MKKETDNKTIYDIFFAFKKEKSKILRTAYLNKHTIHLRVLTEYLRNTDKELNMPVSSFTELTAEKFMDYIYSVRNVSNIHYNNVLKFYKALFNWIVEQEYITINPFSLIKQKTNPTGN